MHRHIQSYNVIHGHIRSYRVMKSYQVINRHLQSYMIKHTQRACSDLAQNPPLSDDLYSFQTDTAKWCKMVLNCTELFQQNVFSIKSHDHLIEQRIRVKIHFLAKKCGFFQTLKHLFMKKHTLRTYYYQNICLKWWKSFFW